MTLFLIMLIVMTIGNGVNLQTILILDDTVLKPENKTEDFSISQGNSTNSSTRMLQEDIGGMAGTVDGLVEMQGTIMKISIYCMLASFFLSVVFGFLYDLWGRKIVMGIAYSILIVTLCAFPWLMEDMSTVIGCRIAIAIALTAIIENPLICNFIKKSDRGKGSGIEVAGGQAGEILSFTMMMTMSDYSANSFYICAGMVCSIWLIQCVVDKVSPKMNVQKYVEDPVTKKVVKKPKVIEKKKPEISAEEKTVKNVDAKLKKMRILRDRLLHVSNGNFDNLLVFYGSIVSRLLEQLIQSFYLLWLLGFTKVDTQTITLADGTSSTITI